MTTKQMGASLFGVLMLTTVMACSTTPPNPTQASTPPPMSASTSVSQEPTLISEYAAKLSSDTKQFLSELPTGENPPVSVILRISGSLEGERRARLEATGAQIRTVAGDIVTATVPSRSLRHLVELDFVTFVEVSRPLYPETQSPG